MPSSDLIDGIEWRYLDHGKVAHALTRTGTWGLAEVAACGTAPTFFRSWLGTGSQVEYETARDMAGCKRCLAKLGIPTDHEHPCPGECRPGAECCICEPAP